MRSPTRAVVPLGTNRALRLCLIFGATIAVLIALSMTVSRSKHARGAAIAGPIIGQIVRMSVTNPADVWSAGSIEVGGQNVTIPRNLLIDLPANRLTLQQLFTQAPPACITNGESGLAEVDKCNPTNVGGIVSIAANRTDTGDLIAGDMFIQKATDTVAGNITYINLTDGYFRVNGNPNDATTGVMVRLNDPSGRHTVQQGLGCTGGPNCSPDPRFTEDPDNYTQTFVTGFPLCLPSTVSRSFVDALDLNNNGNTTETLTTQATATGTGDLLCPAANHPALPAAATPVPVADSRLFAPVQLGDYVTATGNFELVGGAWFLSSWHTTVNGWLTSPDLPNQPDYMKLDIAQITAPAYNINRIKSLFQGETTAPNDATFNGGDVKLWSTHHDPQTSAYHEFPLATSAGCDTAAGKNKCTLIGGTANTFRIKYDVDFRTTPPAAPLLDACPQLRADPVFAPLNPCPAGGTLAEDFGVLSPITHETQARTTRKVADMARVGGPLWHTLDLHGANASNGQYLFPMGVAMGGIDIPLLAEINFNGINAPYNFSGLPWLLDRRLSPGGCPSACEAAAQPLSPFPFEGLDPRTQASLIPTGAFSTPLYTASPLSNASNRILSFVDGTLTPPNFRGDSSLLTWPPADPAAQPATPALPPVTSTGNSTVPGAPTAVLATAGNAQAAVSWTAPASDGGSAITSYAIVSTPAGGSATVTAPATTATVTGLTNGTSYTFVVTATNAVGAGATSQPSNAVTPATVPGAPTAVHAVAGNTQATITWTPPASGGNPIDTYTVTASPGGATATVAGTLSTATVTGLTNGTSYTFTVIATSSVGNSLPSAPSNPVTPSNAPPPPAAPGTPTQNLNAVTALSVQAPITNSTVPVAVTWTASPTSGITSYQVQQSTNGGAFADSSPQPAGTATTTTVNLALGNGTTQPTYQFQVRACVAANCSAWATGPVLSVLPLDEGSASITLSGGWTAATVSGSYGGTVRFQTQSRKSASLAAQTFTATGNLAWVSTLGPDRGQATVSVDGGPATTVDLYAPTQQAAQVVFTSNTLAPGSHTLVITVSGTKNASSTGTRVDVDAIIVIH